MARSFVGRRCALGPTLVVPLGVLWQEYRRWADEMGFGHQVHAVDLRALLDLSPWAEVVERPAARGRYKTLVKGVGAKATAPR